jgi:hypothetical protein
MSRAGAALALAAEFLRVLARLPEVEIGRRTQGPKPLLEKLRRRSRRTRRRDPAARARLRCAIGWVDAHLPGLPNCYRRALLEIALDRGAAAEPLRLGLRASGGPRSGHAWLGNEESLDDYDAQVTL